jgi:hypothetical protein
MKKLFLPLVLLLFCSAFLFDSCMDPLRMTVVEPAPVMIPKEIKTIGILNRSLAMEKNQKLEGLEKILSAEGKNLDKEGAEKLMEGIFEELKKNQKFVEIKIIQNPKLEKTSTGVAPAPMSWSEVERLCKENQVDALFTLSYYDTDATINLKVLPVNVEGPLGLQATLPEQELTIRTIIKTSWRIYDPLNKTLWDDFSISQEVLNVGKGINPMKAYEAIAGRKEAVIQMSYLIGQDYATRILPYYIRVSRDYYVKGSRNFKIAKRRARTGDWQGAAELWEQELTNPKRKIAGRACYNMAIINEIDGNLIEAAEWAAKAYTDYRIKNALDYLNILKYRIRQNEILQQQMEE